MPSKIMKILIILFSIVIFILLIYIATMSEEQYTACYKCRDGSYVRYTGDDTYFMRREAWRLYKCEVISRKWKCKSEKIIRNKKFKEWKKSF